MTTKTYVKVWFSLILIISLRFILKKSKWIKEVINCGENLNFNKYEFR